MSRVFVVDGRPSGVVTWAKESALGTSLGVVHLAPGPWASERCLELFALVERDAGPVAFVNGPVTGVPEGTEERLLNGLGFRPFSRSEMTRPADAPLPPEEPLAPGDRIRPVVPADVEALAEAHRRAYDGRFDHYLFLEVDDDRENSRREVAQILGGRWGVFEPAGSRLLERDGRVLAFVLSVRTGDGVLVADVGVDPEHRGHGLGRQVLVAVLHALAAAGAPRVYLNVTEGNGSALRLYRKLGFVTSIPPFRGWYNARLIPVAPEA